MKKLGAQISIAVVCCFLGFMIISQFKMVNKRRQNSDLKNNNPEIVVEIEQLKKEKKEMEYKINQLQAKLRKYETETVGKDESAKKLKDELDETRLLLGETDIHGEGLVIYITPKNNFLNVSNNVSPINDRDLLYIINELYAGGAEAISINDIRITATSGIRNAEKSTIRIDNDKISSSKRITIKAIGNEAALEAAIMFPGSIPDSLNDSCDVKWNKQNDILIKKTNKIYKFKYVKNVQKNIDDKK